MPRSCFKSFTLDASSGTSSLNLSDIKPPVRMIDFNAGARRRGLHLFRQPMCEGRRTQLEVGEYCRHLATKILGKVRARPELAHKIKEREKQGVARHGKILAQFLVVRTVRQVRHVDNCGEDL